MAQKVIGAESESQYVTQEYLSELEAEMLSAAESLEFERAAKLRDRIVQLKKQVGKPVPNDDSNEQKKGGGRGRKRSQRKPNPHR